MTQTLAPDLTPAVVNPILAQTVGNSTPDQLRTILDALARLPAGAASPTAATVTSLLP